MNEDTADAVSKALRRAWQLGQTYWQQADSDSYKQNARSEQTKAMFMDLVLETRATMTQAGAMVAAERERCARLAKAWTSARRHQTTPGLSARNGRQTMMSRLLPSL